MGSSLDRKEIIQFLDSVSIPFRKKDSTDRLLSLIRSNRDSILYFKMSKELFLNIYQDHQNFKIYSTLRNKFYSRSILNKTQEIESLERELI